ncbi:LysR family transcriptional regulator ArgP [Arthrobacter sp. L77]|uniref:LysR family transcriptional regulator ArgP n=1 Tax=Arthrobacter sp. L77 TaxID=1496689 RepID=UPI0005B942C6|nr:LysR family transcriptional regulator ArgP [Arthrobacter sp. L77]
MKSVDQAQAEALAAIIDTGSFEAAASALSVSPSAISQRIRALEVAVGRPVVTRTRPLRPTDAGEAIIRFARRLELLSADLATELDSAREGPRRRITIVVNGDSLHTWVLPALAQVADTLQLEILREDEDYSLELLRNGTASAAITSVASPVQGCSSRPLGVMRYVPVCSRGFRDTWFADGATPERLSLAPVVLFDRKDDLQDQYLRSRTRRAVDPPRHYLPAAQEFADAVRLGMGWGLVSEAEWRSDPRDLVRFDPRGQVDVPLYWQQWRHGSTALAAVGDAVLRSAALLLRPPVRRR